MDQLSSNDADFHPGAIFAIFDGEVGDSVVTHKDLAEVIEAFMDGLRAASLKRSAEIAALRGK